MDKQQLRDKYLARRDSLDESERRERSFLIAQTLFELPAFRDKRRVAFYHSMGSEVQTALPIATALISGKEVFLPVINVHQRIMAFAPYHRPDDLERGPFGIMQPVRFLVPKELPELELVIVPGLVFDRGGHRLGYGAGYYDRYLRESNALHIGLAYGFQVVDEIPRADHDHPVDMLITEEEVIRPRAGKKNS